MRALLVKGGNPAAGSPTATLLRLNPSHRPHRGQTPPLQVSNPTLDKINFRGLTGGVYKARRRIHRDDSDSRLLAIPTSNPRVAEDYPNLDGLYRFAQRCRVASHCIRQCSTCIAQLIRTMRTCRDPFLPPT